MKSNKPIVVTKNALTDNSNISEWPVHIQKPDPSNESQDRFVQRDGIVFAGTHLLIDFWGAQQLDNLELMESAMRESVEAANATLLHIHLHHFTPHGGISGVAVLAESHISVHTWPEHGYAAFDAFMCGDAKPEKIIPVLEKVFMPDSVNVSEHMRGRVDGDNI